MGAEERQAVAERLRKLGSDGERAKLADTVEIVTGDWRAKADDFALALADLIDPTCETGFEAPWLVCGNCRVKFTAYQMKPVRYCPHCGARIVERRGA